MAIDIKKTSTDMTDEQLYLLTLDSDINKLSDKAGEVIEIEAFCHYVETKEDKNGAVKDTELLSIRTTDGETFGTNSATFIKSFIDMFEFFEARNKRVTSVLVKQGESKAGRKFIECAFKSAEPLA